MFGRQVEENAPVGEPVPVNFGGYVPEPALTWLPGHPEEVRGKAYEEFARKLKEKKKSEDGLTPLPTSCILGWYGVDPTFDGWCAQKCPLGQCSSDVCTCGRSMRSNQIICLDNRYKAKSGSTFRCQASCNQPPYNCPSTHCTCVNPDARSTSWTDFVSDRCSSPRTCKHAEFVAVPGTYATDSWCNDVCKPKPGSPGETTGACPCTLCECSIMCGNGIVNGDFEQGLRGWTVARQRGTRDAVITTIPGRVHGDDATIENAVLEAPLSKRMIPALPTSKDTASERIAVMDLATPGSLILYREYKPVRGDVLKFRWAVVNWANDFYVQPDTTSAAVVRNQQFRVDLIDATLANATFDEGGFSWFDAQPSRFHHASGTLRSPILATPLSPDKARNLMNAIGEPPFRDAEPWQSSRFDLTPYAGRKILVVFRAVANQGPMSVVLDDVNVANDICTVEDFRPPLPKVPEAVAVEVDPGVPCVEVCGAEFEAYA
ncbi:hypothetical protein HDU96_008325 [Phlyctochytrium bullatum]|nr:hypothetical protein HDU96_008325 [Phlyctochytrium bullatum]